jgi:hypothetical protein
LFHTGPLYPETSAGQRHFVDTKDESCERPNCQQIGQDGTPV